MQNLKQKIEISVVTFYSNIAPLQTKNKPPGSLVMQEAPGCCFILPLRFFLFGLRLPFLTLEDEGCGENRHGQGDDPNQHAGIASGGGIAAVSYTHLDVYKRQPQL